MQNKMRHVGQNTIRGGNIMTCQFCGKNFKQLTPDQEVCSNCESTVDELSNGKGDDEDE